MVDLSQTMPFKTHVKAITMQNLPVFFPFLKQKCVCFRIVSCCAFIFFLGTLMSYHETQSIHVAGTIMAETDPLVSAVTFLYQIKMPTD